jgi:beta-1,4-mannosyl-glycoprotein beta-1,4-N-acetylglucosaminyltransferase
MRIVDCFPYFNEKELLELRINLLYDYVDKFIICDADRTHSGKPKPFTCRKTIEELNLPQDKIEIVEVNLPSQKETSDAMLREQIQRNFAQNFMEDNDVFIVTDCDEIIDPTLINYYINIAKKYPENIVRIPMVFLMRQANLRAYDNYGTPLNWNTPFICLKHHLKHHSFHDIRQSRAFNINNLLYSDIFITEDNKIVEAGWHFSWMGKLDRIKIKCNSFSHHREVKILDTYNENDTIDPLERKDHILKSYDTKFLPSKIFELERVKKFLLPKQNDYN